MTDFQLRPYQREALESLGVFPYDSTVANRHLAELVACGAIYAPSNLNYAEASYFDGYHFQHIAEWQDHRRVKRRFAQCEAAYAQGNQS